MHVSTGVQSLQTEKVAAFGESPARSCPCGSPDSGQFEQCAGLSAMVLLTLHQTAHQRRRNIPPRKVLLSEARLRVLMAELETARNISSRLQPTDE